jgi:hypothetical protein
VNHYHKEVGICKVGLEGVTVVVNGHMEKMNLEDLVEEGCNDEVVVRTYDPPEVVSCHLETVEEVEA